MGMEPWTWETIHQHLVSEWHHQKPGLSAAKKRQLARDLSPEGERWAPLLASSPLAGGREVAALLMGPLWAADDRWQEMVLALADDADWEVREWAVSPLEAFYRAHPEEAHGRFRTWAREGSVGLKRALAVLIRSLAHDQRALLDHLLIWADALADEPDAYVRKNLGPYAIGDGLLPAFPQGTLVHLQEWSERPAWPARWNAVMAFSAARARPWRGVAENWLAPLVDDEDPKVRRAARKLFQADEP